MKKTTAGVSWNDSDVRATLRKAGLRGTTPRVAVLGWMTTTRGPVSHADVVRGLEAAHVGIDRATVYRNLVDLAECGILRRTDFGDHVWRFELLAAKKGERPVDHPHFVCTDCGEVSCLTGVAVQIVGNAAAPRAVRSRDVDVQLAGRCNDCSHK
ncbi:MAG TPA: Fur family transcriptional regulator [Polyangiaceae bacterium]|jgi:Fur family ferric uptake transcriptional regulator